MSGSRRQVPAASTAALAMASDSAAAEKPGENRRHLCGTPFTVADRPYDRNRDVTTAVTRARTGGDRPVARHTDNCALVGRASPLDPALLDLLGVHGPDGHLPGAAARSPRLAAGRRGNHRPQLLPGRPAPAPAIDRRPRQRGRWNGRDRARTALVDLRGGQPADRLLRHGRPRRQRLVLPGDRAAAVVLLPEPVRGGPGVDRR